MNKRAAQIDRLAAGIGYIATDFERFGASFLDALLIVPMNHAGTNVLGYPVAGVVDSVSDDGLVAGEYSDQKGYFKGAMAKAEEDLLKAVKSKPNARDIFLLAGVRKQPQNAQKFETRMGKHPALKGRALHLWGSEEVAARIVDELLFSDAAVRTLVPFLPELQRIRDEEAASNLAPEPDRGHLERDDVDRAIAKALTASGGLAISGMGGLGKSAAAAAYAARHQDEYDLVIWLEGGEVAGSQQLHSMPLSRGGEQRNVAALLGTRRCLLIVDDADPTLTLSSLTALCGDGSHVLMTRRVGSADSYEIPLLDEQQARALLNQEVAPCPADVAEIIWATVKGHPLTLGLMNAVVRQGTSWNEVGSDCEAVGEMMDGSQRLADRLLGRLWPALERELSVFAWAGQSTCGREFLEATLLPVGLRKLRSNGLMAVDRPEISRLHDVVFAALSSRIWCSSDRGLELDAALESYLVRVAGEPSLRFWTIARVMRAKLERLVEEGNESPIFIYALLAVWDTGEFRAELVPDPVKQARSLLGKKPAPFAVIAVIEAIEQFFLHDKLAGDAFAADSLRARLDGFELLAELPDLSKCELAQIRHHKAKALKRLGEPDAAAELLERVLAGPVPLSESRLQLIDIYRARKATVPRAVALVDEILAQRAGSSDVSHSVFLGAVERLPWGGGEWRSALIRKHAAAIENTIVETADLGVQQSYRTFAAIGRYLSTEEPELFTAIFARLAKPTPKSLASDDDKASWGEIYFEASRLPDADALALMTQALAFYDAEVAPKPFHAQRKAELLVDMGRAPEAETLLRCREDIETSEWIQRLMARARFSQGDPSGALHWIDRALERLKSEHFRSEFLALRHDIRAAQGDPGAIEDLKLARQLSERSNEAQRLEVRLREAGEL